MNNRDMFYQNTNTSYNSPGMFIPPSGFNMNSEYQAYGPNVVAGQFNNQENPYQKSLGLQDMQCLLLQNVTL